MTVFLVNPASANGATGKRWPQLYARAQELGLEGDALLSERPGSSSSWRAKRPGRASCSSSSAATGR